MENDLNTFDLDDIVVPTLDVLQQIDAGELLTSDDLGLEADDMLLGLGDLL